MKRIFLLCAFILGWSISYAQTLYLNENFNYGTTANADITAATTNWVRYSGTVGPTYVVPGLTYAGYPSSGIGGGAGMAPGAVSSSVLTGTDGDARVALSSVISTSSTIYTSFLVNISAAKTTADYFIHLSTSNLTSTIYRARPTVVANGTGYSINFSKSTETAAVGTTVLEFNKTYLFVIKYVFNTTALDDDFTTLYIYSSGIPAKEPGSPLATLGPIGAAVANDPTDLGFIALREGSNGMTGTVDGIRVSDNWGLAVTGTATSVEKNNSTIPTRFDLSQNYPNPFNPSTSIEFAVPTSGIVTLRVFDILGKEVANLVNEQKDAGNYKVNFDASRLSSGVYFYRLSTPSASVSKKMMIVK